MASSSWERAISVFHTHSHVTENIPQLQNITPFSPYLLSLNSLPIFSQFSDVPSATEGPPCSAVRRTSSAASLFNFLVSLKNPSSGFAGLVPFSFLPHEGFTNLLLILLLLQELCFSFKTPASWKQNLPQIQFQSIIKYLNHKSNRDFLYSQSHARESGAKGCFICSFCR